MRPISLARSNQLHSCQLELPGPLRPRAAAPHGARPGIAVQAQSSSGSSWDADSSYSGSITLSAHRTWLRRQRVLQCEPHPSDADIIELNVGGSLMVTSRSTLKQVPGSLLAVLFDCANEHLLVHDAAGRVFLDHDPATFALVLRYLRELKVTGGCSSSVLLPPIPPSEAPSFRSLVAHLGLQVDEAAITAATARGAAVFAAGGSTAAYSTAGAACVDGSGAVHGFTSPYASRPAAGSADGSSNSYCAQSKQQQQWWQRQQLQQQLVRPRPPEVPPSGSASSRSGHQHSSKPLQWRGQVVDTCASNPSDRDKSTSSRNTQANTIQHSAVSHAEASMQYFYLKTSPPMKPAANATAEAAAAAAAPLKVSVYTEADMMAKQQLQQQQQAHGPTSMLTGFGTGSFNSLLSGCDVFCSLSSSRQMLVLSLVARGSAEVDNMFVGVTSASHIDQRGLQIPCFGWRQQEIWGQGASHDSIQGNSLAGTEGLCDLLISGNSACSGSQLSISGESSPADNKNNAQHRQLWQAGDLVQLVLELGNINKLLLKVNGHEVQGCYNMLELPTFRQWCWYLALFRGTEVVAVVFEQGSYSVYSGDHKLTRYLT